MDTFPVSTLLMTIEKLQIVFPSPIQKNYGKTAFWQILLLTFVGTLLEWENGLSRATRAAFCPAARCAPPETQTGGEGTAWRSAHSVTSHPRQMRGGGGEVGAGPHYTHHLFLSEKKPLKGTCFKGKTKLFYKLFLSSFSSENFSCLGLVLLIENSSCMRRIVSSAVGWRGF